MRVLQYSLRCPMADLRFQHHAGHTLGLCAYTELSASGVDIGSCPSVIRIHVYAAATLIDISSYVNLLHTDAP